MRRPDPARPVARTATLAAASILAALAGPALADDRCAAAVDWPGAARNGVSDVIVAAPGPSGALRFCFWNSPTSTPGTFPLDVGGETLRARVEVVPGGPEILHFDWPGAIPTTLDGVPLPRIEAEDGAAAEGLLWRGMM